MTTHCVFTGSVPGLYRVCTGLVPGLSPIESTLYHVYQVYNQQEYIKGNVFSIGVLGNTWYNPVHPVQPGTNHTKEATR